MIASAFELVPRHNSSSSDLSLWVALLYLVKHSVEKLCHKKLVRIESLLKNIQSSNSQMGSRRLFVGDFFELNPSKANTKLRVKMILFKGICFLSFQKEMAGYRKNASLSYRSSISSIYVERRNRRLMVICPIPKNIFQGNYMLEEHCEQG